MPKACEVFELDLVRKTYVRKDFSDSLIEGDPQHCMVCNYIYNAMPPVSGVESEDFRPGEQPDAPLP